MVRLRAIGECVIEVGPARIGPEAERAFALLLVLTLQKGRPLGRHRLVDLLWPGTSEERARHNLRQALYKLRQLGAPVTTESNQLRLEAEAIVPDVLLHGELEGPPPPELLRADMPFGEFLAGYAPDFSAPFRAWIEEQRGVMHARLRRTALRLLLDERRRGNWGAVETLARKVLQLDPLNEEATLGLAEATALTGSKRAALAILDAFLHELGDRSGDIRLPASVLRRRIAERLEPSAAAAATESCFVGRSASVAFLNERFQRARTGEGHTVLIWGEPGIGKTRLLAEFAKMAILDGAQVPRVACQERDVERPLSLFVDAVPLLQAMPGALGISPESVEHLRRLTAHDPAVLEPSAATREAELLFASVRRAIYDLVDAVASEAPLLLICEDVHWLDAQSWRVLRELAATLAGKPVLLVLSSRLPHATSEPPARNVAGLISHRLEPLEQEAALALFESLTAGAAAPTSFRDWCIHVADGSPLYLQLVTAHWRQSGELRAPPSLHNLIRRRVQRLSSTAIRVLQACAVLGRNASFARLEAVLGYRRSDIFDSLARLEDAALIVRKDLATPCKHELIAQAALELLTDAVRHTLHACAAQTLESELSQIRTASLLWDCAEQWHLAGDPGRAVSLVISCASYLLEVGLAHEAVDAYDRALPLCMTDEQRHQLLLRLAEAARRSGQWSVVLSAAKRAATAASTEQRTGDAICALLELEARWRLGDSVILLLPLAAELAQDTSLVYHDRLRAGVLGLIFADNLCDEDSAQRINQAVSALTPFEANAEDEQLRLVSQLIFHSSYGDLSVAIRAARQLAQAAAGRPDLAERVRDLTRSTIPLRRGGFYDEAASLARQALRIAEEKQLRSAACSAADTLATIFLEQGNLIAASQWYERARRWLEVQEGAAAIGSLNFLGARLALARDDVASASALLDGTIDSLFHEQSTRRANEGLALHLDLALRGDRADVPVEAIEALEHGHLRGRGCGGQDYPTSVLVRALCALDRRERALEYLREYVSKHRREQSPLPLCLNMLCNSLLVEPTVLTPGYDV